MSDSNFFATPWLIQDDSNDITCLLVLARDLIIPRTNNLFFFFNRKQMNFIQIR